jgi:CIC family chloride channel protein
MGETQRFLLLSIIIGIFAGLVVVCFHMAIEFLSWSTIHASRGHGWLGTVLWPAAGAGIAYMLVMFLFPTARGSGINYTKAALYVSDGYIPARSVFGKFLVSTISIGTGNPMGPEDPALQMGAGIASYLGRLFRLTREKIRLIAPIGAAAGIGAAFNTPIAAVLLVMEEVVSAWNAGVLGSIVLSAVSAVVVSRHFLGDAPLFRVPEFALTSYTELIVYAAIGVAGGFLSAWFTRYVGKLRQKVVSLQAERRYLLPMGAGLLVGISGLWLPEALGAGYSTIDSALHDRFTWQILLLLGAVKILTTSLCFSTGTPGGMFAPTLFIGAMIGGGMGALAHQYWPLPTSSAGAYVLVGMGTFFAGLFRAPMTSVFMVFEVSATYVIILPVMISNTIAYLISRHLEREPLLHVAAQQDGFDLPSAEEQREAPVLSVEDAMKAGGARLLHAEASIADALRHMDESSLSCALVASGWGNWSWVQRSDLQKAEESGSGEQALLKVLSPRTVIRLYPDLSLDSALRLLGPYPILPVTSRANPNQLLGTLTLEDVHRAYGIFQT